MSDKTIFSCKYFDVIERAVNSGGAKPRAVTIVRRPDGVMVVPVLEPDSFLLVRQFRPATGCFELEFPGGGMEANESPAQAARRELAEETSLRVDDIEPLGTFYPSNGTTTERVHLYLTNPVGGLQPSGQAAEPHIDCVVRSRREIAAMVAAGEITCATTTLAFLLYLRRTAAAR